MTTEFNSFSMWDSVTSGTGYAALCASTSTFSSMEMLALGRLPPPSMRARAFTVEPFSRS
eukprot:6698314-Heterocapsa_arctica.AAC.1